MLHRPDFQLHFDEGYGAGWEVAAQLWIEFPSKVQIPSNSDKVLETQSDQSLLEFLGFVGRQVSSDEDDLLGLLGCKVHVPTLREVCEGRE